MLITPESFTFHRVRPRGRPGLDDEQSDAVRGVLLAVIRDRYAGNATAAALAELLGTTPGAVIDGEAAPVSTVADRYPERAAALVRLRGVLPPEVEARLRSVEVHDDRPLSEVEWIELALIHLREHGAASALTARVRGALT